MGLSAGTRLGPHEILSPIGAGGMGEVYKARDTRLDRIVAIKGLPEHLAESPERKAWIVCSRAGGDIGWSDEIGGVTTVTVSPVCERHCA
jgi:serine/threonine protein kinase